MTLHSSDREGSGREGGAGPWRHLRAICLLPTVVALVIPGALLYLTRGNSPGWPTAGRVIVGGGLIAAGLSLVVWTVRLFASAGQGTLAPWDPTRRLVVRGSTGTCGTR